MAILPMLSLLYAVFALSMATEAMTDGDPGETEVQLPDSSEAMTVGDPGETEVQFSDSSEVKAVGTRASRGRNRASCGTGWTRFGNRCFRFFSFSRTWALAEAYCVSQRGHLVSIHNINEARLVGRLSGNRAWAWIGGGGFSESFTWYWTDGSAFDYSNWAAWEPNNNGGNEHCISTNFGGGGIWNDLPCYQSRPFVCAK